MERSKKYIVGAVALNILAIAMGAISMLMLSAVGNLRIMNLVAGMMLYVGLALMSWGFWKDSNRLLGAGSMLCVLQAFVVLFAGFETMSPLDSYIMLRALGYLNVFSVSIMRINAEPAEMASRNEEYKASLVSGYRKTVKRFAVQAIVFVLVGELLKLVFVPVGLPTIGNVLWNLLLYGVPLYLGVFSLTFRDWDTIPKEKNRKKR